MKKLSKFLLLTCMILASSSMAKAQDLALKTNLLYGGATLTPNLGLEIGLGKRTSFEITAGYNPWNLEGSKNDNKKLVHWLGHASFRYWTCERFNGHFFGLHALGTEYNIGQQPVEKYLFGNNHYDTNNQLIDAKDLRFEGWGAGGGISYGYHWMLSNRISLEAEIGLGAVYLNYAYHQCPQCGEKIGEKNRIYYGPTKASVSLIFMIK